MKIKVKLINPNCKIDVIKKGEWFDLKSAECLNIDGPILDKDKIKFFHKLIPLGIAMELPKDFEAIVLPRSSTYKSWHILCWNSAGVIDSSYCGDTDEWKFPAVALASSTILEGDKICQFRIRPSQKASVWTKLKWLFNSKIEFEYVESLGNKSRGGIGTTGTK